MVYFLRHICLILCCNLCIIQLQGQRLEELMIELDTTSNDTIRQYIYSDLSWYYSRINTEKCLLYADSTRLTAIKINDEQWTARADFYYGVCYKNDGQYQLALQHLQKIYDYYELKKDTAAMADMLYQISVAHIMNSDKANFLITTNQTIDYYRQVDNLRMVAMTLGSKSIYYKDEEDFIAAEEVAQEALTIYLSQKDSSGLANIYNNLGSIQAKQKNYKKALSFYKKQYDINIARHNRHGQGYSLENMGSCHLKLGELKQAQTHLQEALAIRRDLNGNYELTGSLISMSELYLEIQNYNKATTLCLEALTITKKHQLGNQQKQALLLLSKIEEKQHNYKESLSYYRQYEAQKDFLLNETIARQTKEIDAIYNTKEKEKEISNLQLEDQLNQSRISQQRMALGGAAIGLSLLSFLLYRLFNQNIKIQSQHKIITDALKDKDTLLREIHHRVKNNLQVISSLLRIQSNQTTDEIAIDALKEGQSRVNSMSLIHQDLYQKGNLTGISMKKYLERLTKNLFDTYNISHDRIKLSTVIEDIQLDVETVVPLGLIINELITNALKYAFPDNRSGNISVSLKEQSSQLILIVKDDGIGLPNETEHPSFGHGLIGAFATKLDGTISITSVKGTTAKLVINAYRKV